MMRRPIWCWMMLVLPCGVQATDYYVAPNGSDSKAGTSETQAWRTIAKANAALQPGDVVYLRGGTYVNDAIRPARSGASGSKIQYLAYNSEVPTLTSSSTKGLSTAIDLSQRSYVHVQGVHVDGQFPDPLARVRWFAAVTNGSYNTIQDCVFRYAAGWYGIAVDSGAHHNRILNNVIDYVGSYDNGDPANPDTGDSIGITEGAHHNLIDGNLITHGFHNLLAVRGEFNVIRNNILDNNNFGLGLGLGGRDGEVVGQRNIFESNIVRNAGASADNPFNSGFKAEGRGTIVRRNVIFANSGHGIKTEMRDRQPYAQDIHIFHNTFVDNGGPAWQNRHYTEGFLPSGNVFKNNIVFRNRKSAMPGGDDADFAFMGSDGGQLTDTLIESNLVSMQSAGDGKVYVKNEWNFQSLTEAQQHFPNNFRDNIQAVPQFVATQFSVTQDFKLKPGSRGIDEGKPLTRTTGSGSGTQVPVQDAGFFSDGFGLVPGDSIRVGNEPAVQINSINYGTDTITVSRSLQWQAGASVTLDYAGSAPDIGAVELDLEDVSETRPRPPQLIVLQ